MPLDGDCGAERVRTSPAIPEPPSAKSVSAIEIVCELEYGAIESTPPAGAIESCVIVNAPGVDPRPALLFTTTLWGTVGPVVVPSKVTESWSPVCVAAKFAPPFVFRSENV